MRLINSRGVYNEHAYGSLLSQRDDISSDPVYERVGVLVSPRLYPEWEWERSGQPDQWRKQCRHVLDECKEIKVKIV